MLQSDLFSDLPTQRIGHPVQYYAEVGSTNTLVQQAARDGHPEGLVVVADTQTSGRGRMGRGWAAPPGSSLLLSLLLRPTWLPPPGAFHLMMMAGVALCEAVEQATPVRAVLKWPNDVLLPAPPTHDLRKAAGILSELDLAGEQIASVVIGIGVNVNWSPSGIVDGRDLAQVATSVGAASGGEVDRFALLRALLQALDTHYLSLRRGARDALFQEWRGRLAMLGQEVHIRLPQGEIRGIAEDVAPTGALQVRDHQGTLHTINAGDVGG